MSLTGCFSNASIAREKARTQGATGENNTFDVSEFLNEDGHYISHLSRAYCYLALIYLATTMRPSKLPNQALRLFIRNLINNNHHRLQDTFLIQHVFTKKTESIFKTYKDCYKKIYHYFVKNYHMSRSNYEEFCHLIFGPKISKKHMDRPFAISLPFPSYGENSYEIGLTYQDFLQAYCRTVHEIELTSKNVKYMRNVKLPFEHGRSRSMFLYIEHRESIIGRTITVETKIAIISELLFGRVTNDAYDDIEEPDSDFFSSDSSTSSSDSENETAGTHKHHRHKHHKTHTLHQGAHAAIVFKKNKKEMYRKACIVSNINVDGTIDVIMQNPHHHNRGKKKKRKCIRNVNPDRIVGRRHVGFKCIANRSAWKGKGKKAIVVTCNHNSTYDVELIEDGSVSLGLLEEEIFKRIDEPPILEEKHKQVLYRFARKFLVTRNIKKIENKRNALGTILLEISKRLGKGMLSEKLGIGMMNQIKESLIEQKIEVEDHGVKHKHSEMRNVIRLEKLDQQLTDAKAILRLSTLEKYDENDKKQLSKLMMKWKDPETVRIEKEEGTTKQFNIANNNSSNYVTENM